ncbi:unnamed protein product [Gongylonema pulchrum]|uniref:Formyl_trans_N domain-containing protein n=1 Tax=Gongylonema pulchrum TaxID=637853 RepID=A0A183DW95_9BILA|nr:unnamed protein product [Gongylonema pulchrum]
MLIRHTYRWQTTFAKISKSNSFYFGFEVRRCNIILALEAKKLGVQVVKRPSWRKKLADGSFEILADVLDEYRRYNAELNVLAYCSQFIPLEVTDAPRYKSIVYHPSLLPAHRCLLILLVFLHLR